MPEELELLGRAELLERIRQLEMPRRLFLNDGLGDCVVIGCDQMPHALWLIGGKAAPYCATHDAELTRWHATEHVEIELLDASDIEEDR